MTSGQQKSRVLASLVFLLSLQTCQSEDKSRWPSEAQQQRLVELECRRRVECCGSLYTEQDADVCATTRSLSLSILSARIGDAVERGRASFDAARFQACISALEQLDCAAFISAAGGALPAPCRDYVQGKLGVGARCTDHLECETGRCAFVNPPPEQIEATEHVGTCAPQSLEGGDCSGAEEDCLPEFECRPRPTGGHVCTRGAPAGSPCAQGADCDSNTCEADRCVADCRLVF